MESILDKPIKISYIEEINKLILKHTSKILDAKMFDHLYDADLDEVERTYWNMKDIFEKTKFKPNQS